MATAPSFQRSAAYSTTWGWYRDEAGFRWGPIPGENPWAGGKVRVQQLPVNYGDDSRLMGTYLNGIITVDPVESDPASMSQSH